MSNKTLQRYPREVIQGAILKVEDGASLTTIANELGVSKSTVSYWLTNASKFLGKEFERDLNPKIGRIQHQVIEYGWKLYFSLIKKINATKDTASFRDLVYGASELQNRLLQLKPLQIHGPKVSSTTEVEVSEKRKMTFRNFMEKQKGGVETNGEEPGKTDQEQPAPVHATDSNTTPNLGNESIVPAMENGANG
jgi:transposase-like protein